MWLVISPLCLGGFVAVASYSAEVDACEAIVGKDGWSVVYVPQRLL